MKICRILNSDLKDPFLLYQYVRTREPYTAFLESLGEYDSDSARYTIIGVTAAQILYEQEKQYWLRDVQTKVIQPQEDWTSVLDIWCDEAGRGENPLTTGAIGYIGYENNRHFERIPNSPKLRSSVPDLYLVRYSLMFVWDRKLTHGHWVCDSSKDVDTAIELEGAMETTPPSEMKSFYVLGDVEPDFTHDKYIDAINRCISYIAQGDMLQSNITMRFHGKYVGDPFVLYKALRESTPNPYFSFFDFPCPIISTSPESYLLAQNRELIGRPIKGTIRCVINGKDQGSNLQNDRKNRAENTMIADLIRNDIGRVSEIGSVQVPVLCGLKKFNQIYHLETIVKGRIKEGVKVSDVFRTNFPGGSITGAPKIRAMEVIDELEFCERGPYCGALGFWGANGFLDLSIGIRTLYFDAKHMYLHAGGGIVVKSDPEDEYRELLLKVESLLKTVDSFNILNELRQEIDMCNQQLFRILGKRFALIRQVSDLKTKYGIPSLQSRRVSNMIQSAVDQNNKERLGLSQTFMSEILRVTIEESIREEDDERKKREQTE